MLRLLIVVLALGLSACASEWKIHGGPQECVQMCNAWNMELTGMVGVGNQDKTGPGDTACLCQVPSSGGEASATPVAAAGTAPGTAAAIVALEAAQRRNRQAAVQQTRPPPPSF